MADLDPISDDFINEIIKVNQVGVPDPYTTSGEGLRELIKQLRDRYEQEISKIGNWIRMGNINPDISSEQLPLSYKGDFINDAAKAIVFINGQFHLGGVAANVVPIGVLGAAYRPLTSLSFRSSYGSNDIFINVDANGVVSLQGNNGGQLTVDGVEPYLVNVFFRPAVTINDGDVDIIAILPTTISAILRGSVVHLQMSASGGTAPYTFTLKSGDNLPQGLTISASGLISGTASVVSTTTFSIVATDSNGVSDSRAYSVQVTQPVIAVIPANLGEMIKGKAFSQQMTASGGIGSYQFTVGSGSLPAGLTLTTAGALSGTISADAGDFDFSILATDTAGNSGSRSYSVTVLPNEDPSAAAPVLVSAETNYAGNRLTLQFSLPMADPTGQQASFTVSEVAGAVVTPHSVISVAAHPSDNTRIRILLAESVSANTSLVKLTYNAGTGTIKSVYNLALAGMTDQAVSNRYLDPALLTKKMQINLSTTAHPSGLNSWTDVNMTPRLGNQSNSVTPVFDINHVATSYNFTFIENYSVDSHLADIIDISDNMFNNISVNDPVNAMFPTVVRATNAVIYDLGPQQLIFALLKADPSKIYNVTATGWQYGGSVNNILKLTGNNGDFATYHPMENTAEFVRITNLKAEMIPLSAKSGNSNDGYDQPKITMKMSIFNGEKVALGAFVIEECIDN